MCVSEPTPGGQIRTIPQFSPSPSCLHELELRPTTKDVETFKNNKINYNDVEKHNLVSKDKFVALKDGESHIIAKVTANKQPVDVTHLELVPESPIQIVNIKKITVEAFDKKTKTKKIAHLEPNGPPIGTNVPGFVLLKNLIQLNGLHNLNTDSIAIKVTKQPGSKLSVHLRIKACTHIPSTTSVTSELNTFLLCTAQANK